MRRVRGIIRRLYGEGIVDEQRPQTGDRDHDGRPVRDRAGGSRQGAGGPPGVRVVQAAGGGQQLRDGAGGGADGGAAAGGPAGGSGRCGAGQRRGGCAGYREPEPGGHHRRGDQPDLRQGGDGVGHPGRRAGDGWGGGRAGDGASEQGGGKPGRVQVHRAHGVAAGAFRVAHGGDDADGAEPAGGAPDDAPVASGGLRLCEEGPHPRLPAADTRGVPEVRLPGAAHRGCGPEPARERRRAAGRRGGGGDFAGGGGGEGGGHQRFRAGPGGYRVPPRCGRPVRCGAGNVSRPGAYSGQGVRVRREHHGQPGAAVRADVRGPWDGLRHRRQGNCHAHEHAGVDPTGGGAGQGRRAGGLLGGYAL